MKLKSIQYSRNNGEPEEWQLEGCTLDDINLIVGKNATGKTRTLNVIASLTDLLAGEKPLRYNCGHFKIVFENNGVDITYSLMIKNNQVIEEELKQGDKKLLLRNFDGIGKIFADKLKSYIDFQPPIDELAVVNRRDPIQHPLFEHLYQWGKAARHFQFGTSMGQTLNFKDLSTVVAWFENGISTYNQEYVQSIIKDMHKIGYELEDIKIGSEQIGHNDKYINVNAIQVKEKDLNVITAHTEMSSGMFRALSLFIQLNYSIFADLPSCILIDDIGEGLDYTRSTALIELLISKVEGTQMQLIMSTNDQFVMDAVPLKYWSILKRSTGKSSIYNYLNHKEIFDSFKFTGLSNFDFFSSNYYLKEE
jgi:energy-coupling factor transporter ATP-binding protein EcfA2